MKKVIYTNIGGTVFPIEEVAYQQLNQYLEQLKRYFDQELDGAEVVQDMEYRIAELFDQRIKKGQSCITEEDIQAIINIIGSPEAIEQDMHQTESTQTNYQYTEAKETGNNRSGKLYAAKNDKVIGGVCGGLAQYFGVDSALVRIAFALIALAWGTGIFIYILLWVLLPVGEDVPISVKRRLYRNPDSKWIAGVCSGLAAYFNIDTTIVRLIAVLPILMGIFTANVDFINFITIPLSLGFFPSLVILYIILWISLPEAQSVTDKMQMKGEKIDVANLSAAYKKVKDDTADAFRNNKSTIQKIFAFIFKLFAAFIIGIILFTVGTIAVVMIAFLFNIVGINNYNIIPLIGLGETEFWIFRLAIVFLTLIPVVALIILLAKLFSNRKRILPKWGSITLSTLFIASLFVVFGMVGVILKKYKYVKSSQETVVVALAPTDTLHIYATPSNFEFDDENLISWDKVKFKEEDNGMQTFIGNNVRIKESEDDQVHIKIEKFASGATNEKAKAVAQTIPNGVNVMNNHIYLQEFLQYPVNENFTIKQIDYTVFIPKNRVFKLHDLNHNMLRQMKIRFGNGGYKIIRSYSPNMQYDKEDYQVMD